MSLRRVLTVLPHPRLVGTAIPSSAAIVHTPPARGGTTPNSLNTGTRRVVPWDAMLPAT